MRAITIPVKTREGGYSILLSSDYGCLADSLHGSGCEGRRICIVTDSHVGPLYAQQVVPVFEQVCSEVYIYTFEAGEEHKTLDEVRGLYAFLIEKRFDRHDSLAALGGGVVGDMTGFAAATYLRGIRYIQLPTTLLSQVDSSIGGKTAVDFDGYKNMIGAFHMPSLVYANTAVLRTLPDEQYASGMGEILKAGLIRDDSFYEWLIGHMGEIAEKEEETLLYMLENSINIKRRIVEKDPCEKGERAVLNFGHTIGHAIEKLKNYQLPHGQCVALGMVAAAYISWKRQYLTPDEFYEIRDMNVGFDLPASFDSISPEEILETAKHDKKMSGSKIRFILLKKIGKAFVDETVTDEEMLEAIRSMDADLWEM